MSTPMRLIAKKALSPNVYKSPNSQSYLKSPSFASKSEFIRSPKFSKSLPFSKVTFENHIEVDDIGISTLNDLDLGLNTTRYDSPNGKVSKVKVKVIPLVNTPERKKMLKNGLISDRNWNILGKGSFGTVFQALYKDENVAMKLTNKKSSIHRESNALKLTHKNIIKVLRITHDDNYNHAMVVMQHCAQLDLQGLLNNSKSEFSLSIIAKWALDICEALIYCHENGVIHLDVKPKNILLRNNQCLLADFGSSLDLFNEKQKGIYLEQVEKDSCGGGTVVYTAPELFCSSRSDRFKLPTTSADVYSFGITMWQFESRNMPYADINNVHCIIYAVVKNELRPEIRKKSGYKNYQELYTACWKTLPENRISLINVKDKLLQILG